jgi:hypothetical protein
MSEPELPNYKLEKGVIYVESVRAGPITDSAPYRMPVHSNMQDDDPLKKFLQAQGLELATLLSRELGGEHIRFTLMVEKEGVET